MDLRVTYESRLFRVNNITPEDTAAINTLTPQAVQLCRGLSGDPDSIDQYLEMIAAALLSDYATLDPRLQRFFVTDYAPNEFYLFSVTRNIEYNSRGALFICALLLRQEAFQLENQFQSRELITEIGRRWNFTYAQAWDFFVYLFNAELPQLAVDVLELNRFSALGSLFDRSLDQGRVDFFSPIAEYLANSNPLDQVARMAALTELVNVGVHYYYNWQQAGTNDARNYYFQAYRAFFTMVGFLSSPEFLNDYFLPRVAETLQRMTPEAQTALRLEPGQYIVRPLVAQSGDFNIWISDFLYYRRD